MTREDTHKVLGTHPTAKVKHQIHDENVRYKIDNEE